MNVAALPALLFLLFSLSVRLIHTHGLDGALPFLPHPVEQTEPPTSYKLQTARCPSCRTWSTRGPSSP